jgi:hypothetical protein
LFEGDDAVGDHLCPFVVPAQEEVRLLLAEAHLLEEVDASVGTREVNHV